MKSIQFFNSHPVKIDDLKITAENLKEGRTCIPDNYVEINTDGYLMELSGNSVMFTFVCVKKAEKPLMA